MRLTTLVATIGRPGLERTLQSIQAQRMDGDECIVIGATPEIRQRAEAQGAIYHYCAPGGDWGATERNKAATIANGDYVTYLDDDDIATPGGRLAIEAAMLAHTGDPLIFQMLIARTGEVLWRVPELRMGNVGTPMFVLPNEPTKFGKWGSYYGGDFNFIHGMKWPREAIRWMPQVIATIRP